jgi:hypothetical protein
LQFEQFASGQFQDDSLIIHNNNFSKNALCQAMYAMTTRLASSARVGGSLIPRSKERVET